MGERSRFAALGSALGRVRGEQLVTRQHFVGTSFRCAAVDAYFYRTQPQPVSAAAATALHIGKESPRCNAPSRYGE